MPIENLLVIVGIFLFVFVVITGVQMAIMVFTTKDTKTIYFTFVAIVFIMFLFILAGLSA